MQTTVLMCCGKGLRITPLIYTLRQFAQNGFDTDFK